MKKQDFDINNFFSRESMITLLIGAVLAFIISKILDPILSFLYASFLNLGGGFVTFISNFTYRQISNGYSEQASVRTLYLLYLLLISVIFYALSSISKEYTDYSNKHLEDEKRLSSATETSSENVPEKVLTFEELENEANSLIIEYRTLIKGLKKSYAMLKLSLWLLILFLTIIYAQTAFIRNQITALTNNIEIVSPYITDLEYKQLKSTFYSMENSEDYNELIESLSDIATEYSLKLKK